MSKEPAKPAPGPAKSVGDRAAELYQSYVGEHGVLNGLPAPTFSQLPVDEQARWARVALA